MTIANDNAPGLRTEGAAQKVSSTLAHQSTANAPREVAFHTGVYCHVAYSAIADETGGQHHTLRHIGCCLR